MLGQPEAVVAPALGVLRQVEAVPERLRGSAAFDNRREIEDREIIERCIYALVNEGAYILQEGVATCAADIDVIWVNGYGFPRARGGPMFYADTVGLTAVVEAMRRLADTVGPEYWTPAPLLEDLASTRDTFASLCAPGA